MEGSLDEGDMLDIMFGSLLVLFYFFIFVFI